MVEEVGDASFCRAGRFPQYWQPLCPPFFVTRTGYRYQPISFLVTCWRLPRKGFDTILKLLGSARDAHDMRPSHDLP